MILNYLRIMEKQSEEHPIAGIILAAGAASRMGQSKLLLPWKGEPLIHRAARIALEAGLSPVVVVTGAEPGIASSVTDLPLQIADNPAWQAGQSTSVRAGILSLPEKTEAAVFLLGDQPHISVELIIKLVETYRQTHPTILAPYVGAKRTNPVLFDRSVFDPLCHLEGDQGGRSLFSRFPPSALPWPDEQLLLDIDTPEDYQELIGSS